MDMGKVEGWLSTIPSKYTRKDYKHRIQKFEEFYRKGTETLIKSEESGKTIEKFYAWLKEKDYHYTLDRLKFKFSVQTIDEFLHAEQFGLLLWSAFLIERRFCFAVLKRSLGTS